MNRPFLGRTSAGTRLKGNVAALCLGVGLSSAIFAAVTATLLSLSPSATSNNFGPIALAIFYLALGFVLWLPVALTQGALVLAIMHVAQLTATTLVRILCWELVFAS